MTVWSTIRNILATAGDRTGVRPCLDRAFQSIAGLARQPRDVAFTVAIVALSAKMAKADGIVTPDEVIAFRRVVEIPEAEEAAVARLFDLAKGDTAGFETYARRIVTLAVGDAAFLASVLDGLFHIAAADSFLHEAELAFLEQVAAIFGIVDQSFRRTLDRHVRRRRADPYRILGLDAAASDEEVRRRWKTLALETHPDRHAALGLPPAELNAMADRFAAIRSAWDDIRAERGLA